jgi:outer membrane receptor protein involved in Fe transport
MSVPIKSKTKPSPRLAFRPEASAIMIAIGLLSCGTSRAEAETPAPDQDTAVANTVVITASKRLQKLSDLAGTVSAISGAELEKFGSTDAEDMLKLTPGVQFNKGTTDGALVSIRGIGTNSNGVSQGFTQSPTGIYIEDVPFTDPFAFVSTPDLGLFDLERVEVLRGPQGALYGSSSLGGAIRYLVNKPNTRTLEGSVLLGASTTTSGGNGWTSSAMVNLPLADGKAGLRFVINSRKDAGFIDNLGTGVKDANSVRVDGGRAIFTYKPNDDFDVTATYLSQHSKQADGPGISAFNYLTGQGYVKDYDELAVRTAFPMAYDSKFDMITVQANWNIGGYRLTSLSGHQTKSRVANEDFTRDFYTPETANEKWTSDIVSHSTSKSQELRLAPVKSERINWLVGGFWMEADIRRDQQIYLEPRGATPDLRFRRNGRATERAIFGDAEIKLTDKLFADIGARHYKTELNNDRITGITGAGDTTPYQSSDSGVTPKYSLRYVIDDAMSVYALASRGYRFGGISNLGSSPVGLPYHSDSLWNYEAGWRWSPSKTASLDVSVFQIDWSNVQLSQLYVDPVTTRSFLVTGNVGKASSQGVELAAGWRPMPSLSLKSTLAYTKAVTSGGISLGGTPIASGTRLPGTAEMQGSFNATQTFDGPWSSSGRLSALVAYTGKRHAQIDSDLTLPAYTTTDLRASLSWNAVEFTAYVNNATNARGLSSGVDYATNPVPYAEFYPIRPRTVGISARYDF